MTRGAAALLAASAMLLAACAQAPVAPVLAGEHLAGRLALRVDGDAARSFNAAFELDGSPDAGKLALTTPLGSQVALAQWSAGRVSLQADGRTRDYPDLDSLSADVLGEALPLAALFDWLRGRPWPGAASVATPVGFDQLGWQVDVSRRRDGWVEAARPSTPPVRLRAKLDAL